MVGHISNIKGSGELLTIYWRNIDNIPESTILVTADVVGIYHNILHNSGFKTLKNTLQVMKHNAISN